MKRFYSLFLITLAFVALGAYQTINVGSNPNDGTGDTLRSAFQKVNANFTQVTADFVAATNFPGYGLWLTNYDSRLIVFTAGLAGGGAFQWTYNGVDPSLELNDTGFVVETNLHVGDSIFLDANLAYQPPHYEGKVFYDPVEKTLSYYNENNNMTVNVGQETIMRADNKTGANIPEFSAVYVSGSHGHNPEVSLAIATNETKSCVIGVTTTWITNNSTGYVTTEGLIHNVNTKAIGEDGATVYLSTNTPGGLTTNRYDSPYHLVKVGTITYSHVTQGIFFVHPEIRHLGISNLTDNAVSTMTASNFLHSTWKWVDVLVSGSAIASNPSGEPPVLTQWGTSNYFGYAYFYDSAADGDKSYFSIQSPHKIATTNASNPNVWVEPHVHVNTTTFASGTNATFKLDLYYGAVWNYLTNYYAKTNTVSMTNTYQHAILSFGNVTNNAQFSGKSSVIFKGRITRIDGGAGDVGANPVWVDSLDIHVPVTELGTIGQFGD